MPKFIRISETKLTRQEIFQIENFIEQQQLRIIEWRKIDIINTLFHADLSQHINIDSINKIYYGLSKLIIDIQSELIDIQRNFSHAKSLSASPHNIKASDNIEQAFDNVKKHIVSYQIKVRQIQTIWESLMDLAQNPQNNLFL